MKKILMIIIATFLLMIGTLTGNEKTYAASASNNGWTLKNGSWYYYESGKKFTGWLQLNGNRYYLDSSGLMQTGWIQIEGEWYFFDSAGVMKTGWLQINGKSFYLDQTGKMQTGWVQINGLTYYIDLMGVMQTGWITIDGKEYYLYDDGHLAINETIDGKMLGEDGAVIIQPQPIAQKAVIPSVINGNKINAIATAYTNNCGGCIGTTASGTMPAFGRTIAVDKSVIPLGTWVYLEFPGAPELNGKYRAEDTGSAIKGDRIDVFFTTDSKAVTFGKQPVIITIP